MVSGSRGQKGKAKTEVFSSRWGLIFTALGAAIGTGNIWRFPKETASNGGGAFLIAYVIFLFTWSIPLLIAEFSIGKKTRLGTIGSFKYFAGNKYAWMGVWMIFVSVVINFYYAVVMGWTIKYFTVASTGGLTPGMDVTMIWNDYISSPLQVVFFQFVAIAVGFFIVYRGITGGVEKTNRILLPILFFFLIFLAIWALTLPNAFHGLRFLFVPKFEYLGRGETWVRALAQSAWSCSAGMGMAITYAVYMKRREDTALNSFLTGLGDSSASLIAGLAVICTVFGLSASVPEANQIVAQSGTGITFIHLTNLFTTIPGGPIMAIIFFSAMSFAALTSLIAGFESATRNFMDHGWSRAKSIRVVALATFVGGLPSAIIFTWVSGMATPAFLDMQDHVWGLGLILSGLFVSIAIWKYGSDKLSFQSWRTGPDKFRMEIVNTRWNDLYIGRWWSFVIRFLFPIQGIVLFLWYFSQTLFSPDVEMWWMAGTTGLGILLLQWIVVLFILYYYNDWFAKLITKKPGIEPKDGLGFSEDFLELPPDTERVQFIEVDK
jgi:NSS family neurotransmitter:Na+ symporter